MLKRLGYGVILWVIPYATAIPLLVGGVLSAHYFLGVDRDYLKEGIVVGLTWIAVNWLLDLVALLPFTNQTIPRYFAEIWLRYLAMTAPTVALGVVLQRKLARPGVDAPGADDEAGLFRFGGP